MAKANYIEINGEYYAPNHPKVIGRRQHLDRLPNTECQPRTLPPLVDSPQKHRSRKRSVAIVVAITSYRNRKADLTNIISGAKGLQDAIARSFGIDDGDQRIKFEYHVVVTSGAVGTHVLITVK